MTENGWIKCYRSILENPVCTKSTAHLAVWIFLCCKVSTKRYKTIFKGEEFFLKPGQLITSRKSISECFSDLNESKVQRILKDLENAHQIEQQTTSKNRLITLINWDKYQKSEQHFEQQVNNKRTTSEQQVNTNKNIKNIENIKNEREGAQNVPHTLPQENNFLGSFKNVKLTDDEISRLKLKYPNQYLQKIERLSVYLRTSGKKYASHYAVLLQWLAEDLAKGKQYGGKSKGNDVSNGGKRRGITASYNLKEIENKSMFDD